MAANTIELRYTGEFSLAESVFQASKAAFAERMREPQDNGSFATFDLAFPLETCWRPVGISVSQQNGSLFARIVGNPDGALHKDIRAQLERLLSLDVEADGFAALGKQDAIIARLQLQFSGLRPILFPTAYEAAARAIIGHGLPVRQAATFHRRIANLLGVAIDFGDRLVHSFPAPALLAQLSPMPGLSERKIEQLRALGTAAAGGFLDDQRLRSMDFYQAMSYLQQLPGIGPFSAELILLRGVGNTYAFPQTEKRLHRAMSIAYNLGDTPGPEVLQKISDRWSPYRSWVGLLFRNALQDTQQDA